MKDAWKITKNLKNKVKVSQNSTNKANARTDVTNREGLDVLIFSQKYIYQHISDVSVDLPLEGINELVAF
jgi:5-methylcytosine-specific restriction endonuclease McrBC regulatory subunit McrC